MKIKLIIPIGVTFIGSFVMDYPHLTSLETLVQVLMSFANGILEEVLWRGVYITLFPDDILWGLGWPTLWFALWHTAPGSVAGSLSGTVGLWGLVAGALVYGACWGWAAMKTKTIRWSVTSHILTGLVRVLG